MNWDVFITCAITGSGNTVGKSPHVPVTPEQIANSAIDAAKAGAAVVHIHVRDPDTGIGLAPTELYAEVVERIRDADVDVVLNLTAGMGGDLVLGGDEQVLPPNPDGTDMAGATERLDHVRTLLPEICTLDCGTMNFASGGDYIMVNTPGVLRSMAKQVQDLGVRPELEVFDTGHLVQVKEMIQRRAARRSGHDPAVHGHRLRRARRPQHVHGDGQQPAQRLRVLRLLDLDGCSCRSSPWPRSPAATCASGSRTTCTSGRATRPPTPSSSPAPSRSSRAMNVRDHRPAGSARQAEARQALR